MVIEIKIHAGSLQELTADVNFAIGRILPQMRLSYIARLSNDASTF